VAYRDRLAHLSNRLNVGLRSSTLVCRESRMAAFRRSFWSVH
jgi:hypothetical protein